MYGLCGDVKARFTFVAVEQCLGRAHPTQPTPDTMMDVGQGPNHTLRTMVGAKSFLAFLIDTDTTGGLFVIAMVALDRFHLRGADFTSTFHVATMARIECIATLKIKPGTILHVMLAFEVQIGPSMLHDTGAIARGSGRA